MLDWDKDEEQQKEYRGMLKQVSNSYLWWFRSTKVLRFDLPKPIKMHKNSSYLLTWTILNGFIEYVASQPTQTVHISALRSNAPVERAFILMCVLKKNCFLCVERCLRKMCICFKNSSIIDLLPVLIETFLTYLYKTHLSTPSNRLQPWP